VTRAELAARIRELRVNAGITQDRAAKHCGVNRSTWQRYENGQRAPMAHRIPAVARAIDAPIGAIYDRTVAAEVALTPATLTRLQADPTAVDQIAHDLATRLLHDLHAATLAQAAKAQRPLAGPPGARETLERRLASARATQRIAESELRRLDEQQTVT